MSSYSDLKQDALRYRFIRDNNLDDLFNYLSSLSGIDLDSAIDFEISKTKPDVLYLLNLKGFTVERIAELLNISSATAVYSYISCRRKSRRCRIFIASILDIFPSILFPHLSEKDKAKDDAAFYLLKNSENSENLDASA